MTEKNETAQSGAGKKSKGPIIAVAGLVAILAVGGLFAFSSNSSAVDGGSPASGESTLSDIAPAAAGEANETASAAAPAEGEQAIKMGNPVVAKVGDEDIMRSDVFNFITSLPEQVRQMPIQTLFPLALEQVVNNKVVTMKASGANLGADPEVEKLVTQAREQIVRNVYVDREITKEITEKKIIKAYEDLLKEIGEVQETRARHILVDDEAKARDLVKKLDEGADFVTLAKESSSGPSSENGGELGWFAKNEMVPEFAEAAFAVEPGAYTKDPVKTQFGWHVIKVEERRKRPEPKLEDVRPQLENQLRQQALTEMVEKWQKDAGVKKFDINGDPVKSN